MSMRRPFTFETTPAGSSPSRHDVRTWKSPGIGKLLPIVRLLLCDAEIGHNGFSFGTRFIVRAASFSSFCHFLEQLPGAAGRRPKLREA
jgi:hypothetical protein